MFWLHVMLPAIALFAAATAAPSLVPVHVLRDSTGELLVTLAPVDFELQTQAPLQYATFSEVLAGTNSSSDPITITFQQLIDSMRNSSGERGPGLWSARETGDMSGPYAPPQPSGLLFNEGQANARVVTHCTIHYVMLHAMGWNDCLWLCCTAVLSALPKTLVYSQPSVVAELLHATANLTRQEKYVQ